MNFKNGMLALVLTVMAGAVMGCSSPCSDLQDTCDACADGLTKSSCQVYVDLDDGDACEAILPSFEALGCK